MKHDHNVWNQIFKEEQQKNLNRISEVQKRYKESLINELVQKEKKYSEVKSLKDSLALKPCLNLLSRPETPSQKPQGQGGSVFKQTAIPGSPSSATKPTFTTPGTAPPHKPRLLHEYLSVQDNQGRRKNNSRHPSIANIQLAL